MSDVTTKQNILYAIQSFDSGDLTERALDLFKVLGYITDRQSPFRERTYKFFKDSFLDGNTSFKEDKALVKDWKHVDLLFQLTKNEITTQNALFDTKKVDRTIIETYLFFTIELVKAEYSRTELSQITREINKVFPMPVMILFKHGNLLTLSIIDRKINEKDERKDVLKKVTLIKDINIEKPHRAHVEILSDLSIEELQRVHKFTNFVELHNAWQKTLDVKELNKKFYKELSSWYFWAMHEVVFPGASLEADKHGVFKQEDKVREHNAKNLIRVLTRILFVWFIKEKSLIPEELFDENYIRDHLINGFEPRKKKGCDRYYRAILQNLFFATLNQTIGKREFRKSGQHMNVTNLMRYQSYFKDSNVFLKLVEDVVPFMNGGLFECLDSPDPTRKGKQGGDIIVYEDGFSDRPDNKLYVPDYIFFGTGEHADLSEELGDKKQKNVTVSGLINILKSYKFTVAENTPIEEDVALDPELLGRVFENLLASYNPETKTTARKQTGSFYTPREIVNYMVDESLKAYLKQKLETEAGMRAEDAQAGLDLLIGYNEKEHLFDEKQTIVLIRAIDNCKILDPACGSGAFPMGILHKLVHILEKLDPNNKLWKERQIEKAMAIDDAAIREQLIEDIETAFSNNELDYGRKLYLIENCIYGVDIQPIATQISKLRFFISLIVDQKADKKRDNFGIRPLPNLETKFVAANTLIGIEKPKKGEHIGSIFDNNEVKILEDKLKDIRHRLFSAKTPSTKRKLRDEDKNLREQMGQILKDSGWSNESARQLAGWDPYDQNASSPFFDPEWMFGISSPSPVGEDRGEGGFDVVIANPPYIKEYVNRNAFDGLRDSPYYQGKMDIWYLFACNGLDLLEKPSGILTFIAQNNWTTSYGASKMRNKVINDAQILSLIDFGDFKIFEAGIQTMVMIFKADFNSDNYKFDFRRLSGNDICIEDVLNLLNYKLSPQTQYLFPTIKRSKYFDREFTFSNLVIEKILNKICENKNFDLDEGKEVAQGIVFPQDYINKASQLVLGDKFKIGDGMFVLNNDEKNNIPFTNEELELIKPAYSTKELFKWCGNPKNTEWVIYTDSSFKNPITIKPFPNLKKHLDQFANVITSDNKPYGLHRARNEYFFKGEKIISVRKCLKPTFTYTDFDCYVSATFYVIKSDRINLKYLTALLNSQLIAFWLKNRGKMQGNNYQIDKEPLLNIPIKLAHSNEQRPIIELVDKIRAVITDAGYQQTSAVQFNVHEYEKQIDQIIYKLYGLTDGEIAVAEANSNT